MRVLRWATFHDSGIGEPAQSAAFKNKVPVYQSLRVCNTGQQK